MSLLILEVALPSGGAAKDQLSRYTQLMCLIERTNPEIDCGPSHAGNESRISSYRIWQELSAVCFADRGPQETVDAIVAGA